MRRDPATILFATVLGIGAVVAVGGIALLLNPPAQPWIYFFLVAWVLVIVGLFAFFGSLIGIVHVALENRHAGPTLTIEVGNGKEFEATRIDATFTWEQIPTEELGAIIQEKLIRVHNISNEVARSCRVKVLSSSPLGDTSIPQGRLALGPPPWDLAWRDTSGLRDLAPHERDYVILDRQVAAFNSQVVSPWQLSNGSSKSVVIEIGAYAENVRRPPIKHLQLQFGELKAWVLVKELLGDKNSAPLIPTDATSLNILTIPQSAVLGEKKKWRRFIHLWK